MNERQAIAILLASFRKGKKFSDPMTYAESAKFLIGCYGSAEAVAEKLGVGKEAIRALAQVVDMPKPVKTRITDGRLLLTVAFDLIPLDKIRQVRLAEEVSGLSFKNARAVIRYSARHPNVAAKLVKERALEELERRVRNFAIVRVPGGIHEKLANNPEQIIERLCRKWFNDGTPSLQTPTDGQDLVRLVIKVPRAMHERLRSKDKNIANLIERIAFHYLSAKQPAR